MITTGTEVSAAMTETQRGKLVALAENPKTAERLLSQLDNHPKAARVLWDVYCMAVLTVGGAHGESALTCN